MFPKLLFLGGRMMGKFFSSLYFSALLKFRYWVCTTILILKVTKKNTWRKMCKRKVNWSKLRN